MKKLLAMVMVCMMVLSLTTALALAEASETPASIRFIMLEVYEPHVQEALVGFREQYPNIEVEVVAVPDINVLKQTVLAANQAGDDYDLMYVNHVDTLTYIKGEILHPIEEFVQADGVDYSGIVFESLLEPCVYDGQQYVVPATTDTRVLAINKDLFEKYGQQAPVTQEDMLKVAEALTNDGNYGFVNSITRHAYVPEYEQGVFLRGNGGRLYEIQDGKAVDTIDTQVKRDYLKFNQDLLQYMPGDSLSMNEDDGRKAFASGNVGMYIWGPWEFTFLTELPFEYELITIPGGSVGSASTSGGYQLGIGSGSENPRAAWELLKYLTVNPDMVALLSGSGLPPSEAAYGYAPFNDSRYDIFKEQLKTSSLPQIPVANLSEVVEGFNVYWQDVLYNKISIDDACVQAQETVQKLLDKVN